VGLRAHRSDARGAALWNTLSSPGVAIPRSAEEVPGCVRSRQWTTAACQG
jgi:hypothetical protein